MASLEQKFEAATSAREIPGVVLLASKADGTFKYEKAIGPTAPNSQIELDSTFIMASCTKLITSIAGLRCVEQEQIGLDDDLSSILTEFKGIQILEGFKTRTDGKEIPILKPAQNKITLSPLNINDITFHRDHNPHVQEKLVKMTFRSGLDNLKPILAFPGKGNGKVEWTDENLYIIEQKDCWGGQRLAGSASSYLKILTSLLRDDEILLKKSTTTEMIKPQISEEAVEGIRSSFVCADFFQGMFSSQIPERELNHGLGGLLIEEDIEGGKKKGTLTWSGMPNLLRSIDKEAGLACLYASNVLPFGDPKSHEMQQLFEKEMYKKFGEFQKTLK